MLFLVLMNMLTYSQGVVFNYPVQFSQVHFSKGTFNPALVCHHAPLDVFMGTQQYTGHFKNVSTQFALAGIQIPFSEYSANSKNIITFRFTNDQEGYYISRNRGYAGYSFHTRIGGDYYLAGGIEIGTMGYAVQGTPSTGNASRYIVDGSSGVSVYNSHLTTGISLNQAFNNEIQPLDEVTRLYRHLNVFAGYHINISNNFELYPTLLFRFPYKSVYKYNLDASVNAVLNRILLLGTSYRYKNGLSFSAGVTNLNLFNGYLTICMAYNSPVGKSSLNISIIEIQLNYKHLKKERVNRLPSLH